MDFELSAEQAKLAASVRKFAVSEVAPAAEERDKTGTFPRNLWKRMGETGLFGLLVPLEYGGTATDFRSAAVAFENFTRFGHDLGLSVSLTVTTLISRFLILRHGNDKQKQKYLPSIVRGETIPAFAVSERKHGSHPRYLETTAKEAGRDYVINGRKMYITNGPVADVVIVFAVTDTSGEKKGISAFLIERGTPGLSVGEVMALDFCRSSPHSELVFDECRVPAENMIGEKDTAFDKMVRGVRVVEDSLGMPGFVGFLQWMLELALNHLSRRKTELSPEQHIILSDAASILAVTRTVAHRVARLRDAGEDTSTEFTACHLHFPNLVDSAMKNLKDLFDKEEDIQAGGLERPLRDMRIGLIGRNLARLQKQKFAARLLTQSGD